MDGCQRAVKQHSLQKKISRWIIIASAFFALFAGIIAGVNEFLEAQETQDVILRQIGELATHFQIASITVTGGEPEEPLIVQSLRNKEQCKLPIDPDCPDGLYTLKLNGSQWRTLILTTPPLANKPPERFAIAQKTEYRNELAWNSSLNIFLAVLLLTPLLIGLVHFILHHSFKPVATLAKQVDQRLETDLTPLPEDNIPDEITPFIISINQLLLRINKVLNQQRRFVADAAHELRTPLTALSLLSENLVRSTNIEQTQQRLIPLQKGMKRMQALVNQLLCLAQIQGKSPSDRYPVNINRIAREVIAELHPLAESKAIDLGMTQQENVVLLDTEDSLVTLLRNALSNALNYTPKGGQIDISLFTEKGVGFIQVKDNGPGIEENELTHMFEPFRRARENREPGNGLGLTISLEIAKRLGGEINLQNQPQGGLLFLYKQPLFEKM